MRLAERLDAFWYAPAPAARLRTVRVLVGAYALSWLAIGTARFTSVTRFRPSEFAPVGPVALLAEPLPGAAVQAIFVLALLAGVGFVSGYRYRVFGPLFAFAFLWVTSYRSSWGMKFHTENLVALHLLLLALAPAGAARGAGAEAPHGRYGWAIRAMSAVTAATYLLAGLAKLRLAGVSWLSGDVLRVQVAYDNLRKIELGSVHSPLGVAIVSVAWPFTLLGVATLFLELGAPLALFGKKLGRAWAIGAFAFHLGVLALMAIAFPYPLFGVAYASFFEVERWRDSRAVLALRARFARRLAPSRPDC